MTGDWMVGSAVALVEPMVNTVAYHFHEKVWLRIRNRNGNPPADSNLLAA